MPMNATYATVHVQLDAGTLDEALLAATVARQHGLQVNLSDGVDDLPPALIVNLEITAESSQDIYDAMKGVHKFLGEVTNAH